MKSLRTPAATARAFGAALAALVAIFALVTGLTPASTIDAAAADPPPGSLDGLVATNGAHSANAPALLDGTEGANPGDAWANSSNPWSSASYPMNAVIDLGDTKLITAVHYYGGQIPFPNDAALTLESSTDGATFQPLATATSPTYDAWSDPIAFAEVEARYVRVQFLSKESRFDVTELAIVANDPDPGGPGPGPDPDPDPDGGSSSKLSNLSASDGDNSTNAGRLVDDAEGPNNEQAWSNPNPWDASNFPMTADIDLDGSYELVSLRYFVGNIQDIATNRVTWEYSPDASGETFSQLTIGTGHAWNDWHEIDLAGQQARRLRVRFDSVNQMFNLAEIEVYANRTVKIRGRN